LSNIISTRLRKAQEGLEKAGRPERKKERKIMQSLTNVVTTRLTKALER
jgi:hypothetical protein